MHEVIDRGYTKREAKNAKAKEEAAAKEMEKVNYGAFKAPSFITNLVGTKGKDDDDSDDEYYDTAQQSVNERKSLEKTLFNIPHKGIEMLVYETNKTNERLRLLFDWIMNEQPLLNTEQARVQSKDDMLAEEDRIMAEEDYELQVEKRTALGFLDQRLHALRNDWRAITPDMQIHMYRDGGASAMAPYPELSVDVLQIALRNNYFRSEWRRDPVVLWNPVNGKIRARGVLHGKQNIDVGSGITEEFEGVFDVAYDYFTNKGEQFNGLSVREIFPGEYVKLKFKAKK
jgi:hypothetical protein